MAMSRQLTIKVTDAQARALDEWASVLGVTRNAVLCLALHDWIQAHRHDEPRPGI